MSGLRKAKKYDWKDSNMALFGSDTDKKVKKESAETEPAWKGAGQKPGLQIWRIVKFKVTDWPTEDYGQFYSGDSYIILNTYKEEGNEELLYDVHFWIGKYSTQDEYGTAAYKTVELDTMLDDKPVQHRETQGFECDMFKGYFDAISVMKGGADTGFRRVLPEEYKTRLLKFCGLKKSIAVTEVPTAKSSLNSDDVFIIDMGLQVYQYNGSNANKDERFRATQYLQKLKSDRGGKVKVEVLDERDTSEEDPAFNNLKKDRDDDDDEDDDEVDTAGVPTLYRISDASGNIEFSEVAQGKISKSMLDSKDVFIFDNVTHLFVWTGSGASIDERRNAMSYAHKHLMKSNHPTIPVTCVCEGGRSDKDFEAVFK
ncbi:gelsolin-like protein 2 [Mizuhopecten yessoensis]|uniref:Actin-modulator n=1 Tax=Mizuhopecten yessoensis TaxID=6573 RepID=A0A210Q1A6_MIZYE|nr:gelsolin-like protein 2 [Mizuhopecten yessoensis]OWF42507.1 Gelsolin-like protein 2 [Mizuhopecten yessoensis]